MTPRDLEEYKALRATIRERGTARIWVVVAGLAAWAALAIATATLATAPVATFVPLVVLSATFEAACALHFGVERIGRYLEVYHDDRWEQTIAVFGRGVPGAATDPLFVILFAIATLLNLVPAMLAEPTAIEIAVVGAGHFALLLRLAVARRAAVRQRALERDRFVQLKAGDR